MFNKKLVNILSSFSTIINELDTFTEKGNSTLGDREVKIAQLESEQKELKDEMVVALKVRKNLSKLIEE